MREVEDTVWRLHKDFREEAVRLVMEGSLSAGVAADRRPIPKSTLERWIKVAR